VHVCAGKATTYNLAIVIATKRMIGKVTSNPTLSQRLHDGVEVRYAQEHAFSASDYKNNNKQINEKEKQSFGGGSENRPAAAASVMGRGLRSSLWSLDVRTADTGAIATTTSPGPPPYDSSLQTVLLKDIIIGKNVFIAVESALLELETHRELGRECGSRLLAL
jgi:hypothetical protein